VSFFVFWSIIYDGPLGADISFAIAILPPGVELASQYEARVSSKLSMNGAVLLSLSISVISAFISAPKL